MSAFQARRHRIGARRLALVARRVDRERDLLFARLLGELGVRPSADDAEAVGAESHRERVELRDPARSRLDLDPDDRAPPVELCLRDDLRVALARRRAERGRVRDDAHARDDPHHADAGGARGAFLLARGEVPPTNRHALARRRLVEQGAEPFEPEVVAGFARRPVAVE